MRADFPPTTRPPARPAISRRAVWFRICLTLFVVSGIWAGAVALTGGFTVDLGVVELKSRNPRNVVIIAALTALLVAFLARPGRRFQSAVAELDLLLGLLPRLFGRAGGLVAPVLAGLIALAVIIVGCSEGAFVAGGADSYGYLSQARLWAQGRLQVEQPIMTAVSWPFSDLALTPLGYRPAPSGPAIVPVYAPGLPMAMALFERVAGSHAVFYVVPLLGGVAVWATYLMGSAVAGPAVGLTAAVLLATSPVFLYQLMFPMSDVPVTAWWALCLALLPYPRRAAALAAGLLAGIATLTRPNLVPILCVPGMFLLWAVVRHRHDRGPAVQRLLLFVVGPIVASLVVAYLNARWYGGVLKSGYGPFDYLYRVENLWPNITQYSSWLLESQTPVVLLAVVAPFLLGRGGRADSRVSSRRLAVTWLSFIAAVAGCYAFYAPFEVWWYLRFLLPAFPALLVLTSIGLIGIATRLAGRPGGLAAALVVAVLAWHGVQFAKDRSAFQFREGERKYSAVGDYIGRQLPERAVLICLQHSGSIRYYSGRLTVRYDWIPTDGLEDVIEQFRGLGYHPYFVLETTEMTSFEQRFQGESDLAQLNWFPRARLRHASEVNIYDPADKWADHQPVTDIIY
ncbi:MAG: hypothetical protein ABI868_20815 [Acidobacteriota bacterium]